MRRCLIALLLALALAVAGCRSTEVSLFGVPVQASRAAKQSSSSLSSEEKVGVIVVLIAAGALIWAGAEYWD